uniref:FMRFamide-like neuropeptide 3 n=1 Tax=Homarus americanus TaxID=6706 RepID=FAR3_HOMAM|nr:RecName: Full=FMRFamide-like neuropeptide 3; Short=FLI 3; AltName: Full=F2 [Homarus americanus]prf//1923341A SDRNFLRFamide [Cancer borealis]
SDRNFLRF